MPLKFSIPDLKELNQNFLKDWETRLGFIRISGTLALIVTGFLKAVVSIAGIMLSWFYFVGSVIGILSICFIVWFLGRKGWFHRDKIRVSIYPKLLENDENLEKVLRSSIRSGNLGHLFKISIIPSDVCFEDRKAAEKYVKDQHLNLVIWGDCLTGKQDEKDVSQYILHFSYSFSCQEGHEEPVRYVLNKDFQSISVQRYWKVQRENALPEIQVMGNNLVEISLYITGVCLLSKGDIKKGVLIFEDLFQRINCVEKRKLQIFAQVKNHLISLCNFISVVEWAEMRNRKASRLYSEKVLAIDDNNYDCHARLALYDYLDGNQLGSKRHVKRCEKIDRRHPCTLLDKAFFCLLDKKYKSAAKIYKRLSSMPVDGFMAFETAAFLEDEYEKKKEIAFLFGIGMLTLQFVGHNEYGVARLKEFLELAKGQKEYEDFYGKAEALMIGINKKVENNREEGASSNCL